MTRTVGMRMRSLTRTSLVGAIARSSSQRGDGCRSEVPAGEKRARANDANSSRHAPVGNASIRDPGDPVWNLFSRTPVACRLGVRSRRLLLRVLRGMLRSGLGFGNQFLHKGVQGHAVLIGLVAGSGLDRMLLPLAPAEDQHVGDLEKLGVPDLRVHLLLAQVRLDPDSPLEERAPDLLGVGDLR